jgi:hypothetical protein
LRKHAEEDTSRTLPATHIIISQAIKPATTAKSASSKPTKRRQLEFNIATYKTDTKSLVNTAVKRFQGSDAVHALEEKAAKFKKRNSKRSSHSKSSENPILSSSGHALDLSDLADQVVRKK